MPPRKKAEHIFDAIQHVAAVKTFRTPRSAKDGFVVPGDFGEDGPANASPRANTIHGNTCERNTGQGVTVVARKPYAGQQVWFVRAAGPPGTILGTESDRFVAWIDVVHKGGSEEGRPFVDLTYHTQDERGAAVAKMVPHDPSGTKDCSWHYLEGA